MTSLIFSPNVSPTSGGTDLQLSGSVLDMSSVQDPFRGTIPAFWNASGDVTAVPGRLNLLTGAVLAPEVGDTWDVEFIFAAATTPKATEDLLSVSFGDVTAVWNSRQIRVNRATWASARVRAGQKFGLRLLVHNSRVLVWAGPNSWELSRFQRENLRIAAQTPLYLVGYLRRPVVTFGDTLATDVKPLGVHALCTVPAWNGLDAQVSVSAIGLAGPETAAELLTYQYQSAARSTNAQWTNGVGRVTVPL